jgi:hypothetical protein
MRETERRGALTFDVRERDHAAFNQGLQPRLRRSVWGSGCTSWYLNARGDNVSAWPGSTTEFWLRTRRMEADHYELDADPNPHTSLHSARDRVAG